MIKEKTGAKAQRDSGTQDISCRLCGNVCCLTDLVFGGRALARCGACGVMQVEPFPSKNEIASFYAGENFSSEDGTRFKGVAERISVWFRAQRAKHIHRVFQSKNPKILDIGTGRGVMLNHLKNLGWETQGTISGDLCDAQFPPEHFDVVTVFHVFEHLENPVETLGEISRVLKPGGAVVLEAPNAGGFVPRIFKTRWFGYNVPVHLYHFTPESLKIILRQCGFAVYKERYFSAEQSPFVLLQTLMNFLFADNGGLFESLRAKSNAGSVSLRKKIIYAVCLLFLSPASLILSGIAGSVKQGDVMTFYCRKT